jgi:signal transduction histidine kinase
MTGRARSILIVDDEQDFAVSTARMLRLEGVECLIAHDGDGAFAILDAEELQVALLDIRLKGEDGIRLAQRLRAAHPQLIVVIMTAYTSVDSAVAALKAGAFDYLRKPFFLDELMSALGRCFDICDLRQAKAETERELHLLRQHEAMAQLATGLSHDFRNMLAVIQANLAVLDQRLAPNHPMKPYATDAHEAAGTASEVLARLSGFLRGRPHTVVPVDLRGPVTKTMAMMGRTLCADMTLVCDLPETPLMVQVDPHLVETALVNLLINARDATGGQGRVVINLRRVTRGADYARLVLRDDGPGLAPEAAARALEPFFTTKAEGSGLGLAMIHQMALSTGGSFRVANAAQGGAEAVLELPCLPHSQDGGTNM